MLKIKSKRRWIKIKKGEYMYHLNITIYEEAIKGDLLVEIHSIDLATIEKKASNRWIITNFFNAVVQSPFSASDNIGLFVENGFKSLKEAKAVTERLVHLICWQTKENDERLYHVDEETIIEHVAIEAQSRRKLNEIC